MNTHSPRRHTSLIVGLTGGIGSGKTAVSDWFAHQGIDIIDADVIAHALTVPNAPLLYQLKDSFGDWVILPDGSYHRKAMRQLVFNNPDALAKLNAIVHPAIHSAIMDALAVATSPYAVLSVPLLFEGRHKSPNLLEQCQALIVVDVPTEIQLARISQRDGVTQADAAAILKRQMDRTTRLTLAQKLGASVIVNDTSLNALHAKLQPLHLHYLNLAKQLKHDA